MSYAEVTGHNIPDGEMPEPSQDLRDGLVPSDEDKPLKPSTDDAEWEKEKADLKNDVNKAADKAEKHGKEFKKKAKAELDNAENAIIAYWNKASEFVLRPHVMGGLLGVANVGLLAGLGYTAYINKDRPYWDRNYVGGALAGVFGLFAVEGMLTESYLETPEGQAEYERAKREGSHAYVQAKEVILRPGVAGGLVGLLNVAVLGGLGFFAYQNWNRPWDRKITLSIGAGLVALSGLEGFLGKKYVDEELPKRS